MSDITVGELVDRLLQYPREERLLFCLDEPNLITDIEVASLYRQTPDEGGAVCVDFEPTALKNRVSKL